MVDVIRSPVWDNAAYEISQGFGIYNADADRLGWYDYAVDYGWPKGTHIGLDIAMPKGTRIRALNPGTVFFAGFSDSFRPKPVWIETQDNPDTPQNESGHMEIYGHLWDDTVTTGQTVKPGQMIGFSGEQTERGTMTPDGSGPHLHFELRRKVPVSDQVPSGWLARDPALWLQRQASETGDTTTPPPEVQPNPAPSPPDNPPPLSNILSLLSDYAGKAAIMALAIGIILVGVFVLLWGRRVSRAIRG